MLRFEDFRDSSEEELLVAIGRATQENYARLEGQIDTDQTLAFGPGADLRFVGQRVLRRIEKGFQQLICGSTAEGEKDRKAIQEAIGLRDNSLPTLIVTLLSTHLGISADIAVPVAILLSNYVIVPAGDELCKFWAERISKF